LKLVFIESRVPAVEVSTGELLAIAARDAECGAECSTSQANAALNDRRTLLLALAQKETDLVAAHALLARVSTAPVLIVDDETLVALDTYVNTQVLRAA
jgi:hypothetical protein